MNNAELIKALRYCANDLPCETESYRCKYADILECNVQLRVDAAAALEAADLLLDQNTQRCEALRKQLRESHESYEKRIAELEKYCRECEEIACHYM